MFGIRDIETVREVVRRDGFRSAAEVLGVSQSAVSNRIAALERELGIALFDRSRRKARLTPEGRRFLEEAERIVALRDRVAARYRATEGGATLRLGVAETIVHTRMEAVAAALRSAAPGLRIELAVESSPALADLLTADAIDLAILMSPFVPPGARSRPFGRFEMGWYAAPDLDCGDASLGPREVARHPVVTFARGTLPYRDVERRLSSAEIDPPLLHGSASLATVVVMVAGGTGIGTLPHAVAEAAVADGRLREVAVDEELRLAPLEFAIAHVHDLPGGLETELASLANTD